MKLPFIEAGEIVTTHGVRGEVKVLILQTGMRIGSVLLFLTMSVILK